MAELKASPTHTNKLFASPRPTKVPEGGGEVEEGMGVGKEEGPGFVS